MATDDSKRLTRGQFAPVAERYRTSIDHTDAEDRDILMSRLALFREAVVLDVATGGGHTAAAIARASRRVVASDLTPEMLAEARTLAREKRIANIDFAAADAERLPFRTGAFDRVACRIAPHHFADVGAAVSEMARVAKAGGLIGIVDSVVPEDPSLDAFINGVERLRDPSHVRSYRVEEWVSLFHQAGLTLQFASTAWKEHAFPEWVSRTGRPEAVRGEVEEIFLRAFPRAHSYFRVRIAGARVVSYSDEKGIFIARKPGA